MVPHFYPRSPCGERLNEVLSLVHVSVISIHALLAESDVLRLTKFASFRLFLSTLSLRRATSAAAGKRAGRYYFYPRSPCGERPKAQDEYKDTMTISIHALLAESDQKVPQILGLASGISIHALLAESD